MKLRTNNIQSLGAERYDVAIVGGGINGAVCAAALSVRGAKVALIERGDFSSGTSQESSNLVWGGIKYLESFEFGLVRKLCLARNALIRDYPSTVKEIRFYTIHDKNFRRRLSSLYCGSWIYWLMGNCFTKAPRWLSRTRIAKEEPVIDLGQSDGGLEYSDAYLHDNDARFVFGFIRTALDHGASIANYTQSEGAQQDESGWRIDARDLMTDRFFQIRSDVLINACGPLVDSHNEWTGQQTTHRHIFSKGIHLIVDKITPRNRVLTFFANDGRLFFAVPMGPKTCIGTTDTPVEQPETRVTDEDRRFVLDNINDRLSLSEPLTVDDIISERCGVRPLVVSGSDEHGRDWMQLSRRHNIELNAEERHISIFGGKLTDCINVGESVCHIYEHDLKRTLSCSKRPWFGEAPSFVRDDFMHQARLMGLDAMTDSDSSELLSARLWRRYGDQAFSILDSIRNDREMARVLIKGTEYIRAEILQTERREMITKLDDFLRRRSKIAMVARTSQIRSAPGLLEACHIFFGEHAQSKIDEYFSQHEN